MISAPSRLCLSVHRLQRRSAVAHRVTAGKAEQRQHCDQPEQFQRVPAHEADHSREPEQYAGQAEQTRQVAPDQDEPGGERKEEDAHQREQEIASSRDHRVPGDR
jgi:hypothetical protein